MRGKVTVRVPATTANLGPGFDTLGMALAIHSTFTVSIDERFHVEVEGEGRGKISTGPDNLVLRAMGAVFEKTGRQVPPIRLHAQNGIPLGRGLGSSAAAVVAGIVAANALCGYPLSVNDLLSLGTALEGHPDNVAPALLGGCIASTVRNGEVIHGHVPVPKELRAALFIPDFEMPTQEARAILPDSVRRADAVFNVSRVALLVTAMFNGQLDLLRVATEDRLHQPARQAVFPAMPLLFQAALDAGALGVFLSGAGSTILALCTDTAERVSRAMAEAAGRAGLSGRNLVTAPSLDGAKVVLGD